MYQLVRYYACGSRYVIAQNQDPAFLLEMALTYPVRRSVRKGTYSIIEPVN